MKHELEGIMIRNLMLGVVAASLMTSGCAREEAREAAQEEARRDEYREEAKTPTETAPGTETNLSPTMPPPTQTETPGTPGTVDETNTGMNVRDRDGNLPTPQDQSNKESDLQITARIRQAILDDQTLSVTAENIKIITADGKVTLRGPVKSAAEKSAIVAKAQQVAGTTQVDDQLEITGTTSGY
jgi:hypothetical protein